MMIMQSYRRYLIAFTVLMAAHAASNCQSRASEPPPIIGPMKGVVRDVRKILNDERPSPKVASGPRERSPEPRHVAPADGPMCMSTSYDEVSYAPALYSRLAVLLTEPPTEAERIEVATQIASCKRGVGLQTKGAWHRQGVEVDKQAGNPFLVLAMVRLEAELGVPPEAKGILGAAWCIEAAMRSKPRPGDEGHSLGPFQMQGWFWDTCKLPVRDDVTYDLPIAATCYWSMVEHYLSDGKCPGNVRRAEAMAANGKRYGAIARGEAAYFREPSKREWKDAIGKANVKRIVYLADLIEKRQNAFCNARGKVKSKHWEELSWWRKGVLYGEPRVEKKGRASR